MTPIQFLEYSALTRHSYYYRATFISVEVARQSGVSVGMYASVCAGCVALYRTLLRGIFATVPGREDTVFMCAIRLKS